MTSHLLISTLLFLACSFTDIHRKNVEDKPGKNWNSGISDNRQIPAKNLFGQPAVVVVCLLKEFTQGSSDKVSFTYNDKKQLSRSIQSSSDGNINTNYTYDEKGMLTHVTGFEGDYEMRLQYNLSGVLETVLVTKEGKTDKVMVSYSGDKIITVRYATVSVTYNFDDNYNLVKAVSTEKVPSGASYNIEEKYETTTSYKNFTSSLGDARFLSLLYGGNFIGESSFGNGGTNFYKKSTLTEGTVTPPSIEILETEVQASNSNAYPTAILFKFEDATRNYKINLTYDCN